MERSAWDKRYFMKLTYWFQEKFAKSRVQYVGEVGKIVHKDAAQKYNASPTPLKHQRKRSEKSRQRA